MDMNTYGQYLIVFFPDTQRGKDTSNGTYFLMEK